MSPVDWASLITEIPHHSCFLCKKCDVFICEGGPAWLLRSQFLVNLANRAGNVLMNSEHSSVTRMNISSFFSITNAFLIMEDEDYDYLGFFLGFSRSRMTPL